MFFGKLGEIHFLPGLKIHSEVIASKSTGNELLSVGRKNKGSNRKATICKRCKGIHHDVSDWSGINAVRIQWQRHHEPVGRVLLERIPNHFSTRGQIEDIESKVKLITSEQLTIRRNCGAQTTILYGQLFERQSLAVLDLVSGELQIVRDNSERLRIVGEGGGNNPFCFDVSQEFQRVVRKQEDAGRILNEKVPAVWTEPQPDGPAPQRRVFRA